MSEGWFTPKPEADDVEAARWAELNSRDYTAEPSAWLDYWKAAMPIVRQRPDRTHERLTRVRDWRWLWLRRRDRWEPYTLTEWWNDARRVAATPMVCTYEEALHDVPHLTTYDYVRQTLLAPSGTDIIPPRPPSEWVWPDGTPVSPWYFDA